MPLSRDLKNLLQEHSELVPQPVDARESPAMRLNLPSGRRIGLISRTGVATEAGKYFYKHVKKTAVPDSRWDDNAPTYRYPGGRTDYVKMRSGAEVALRTWHPNRREFSYTTAGKAFYKRRPRTYIVQVPVTIYTRRRSGDNPSYYGTYPAADFSAEIR